MQEQPGCPFDIYRDIVPMMKQLIVKSIYSVRKTIDPNKRKYCFELFGYDFILDEDFNCWLIEVNTNPCLEESSQLLKMLLPRMVEDMLKLTVDQIFPRHLKKKGRVGIKSPKKEANRKSFGDSSGPSMLGQLLTKKTADLDCI